MLRIDRRVLLASGFVLSSSLVSLAQPTPRMSEENTRLHLIQAYSSAITQLNRELDTLRARNKSFYEKEIDPRKEELYKLYSQLASIEQQRQTWADEAGTLNNVLIRAAEEPLQKTKARIDALLAELPALQAEHRALEGDSIRLMQKMDEIDEMHKRIDSGRPDSSYARQQVLEEFFARAQDSQIRVYRDLIRLEQELAQIEDAKRGRTTSAPIPTPAQVAPLPGSPEELPRLRQSLARLQGRGTASNLNVELERQKMIAEYQAQISEIEKNSTSEKQIEALQKALQAEQTKALNPPLPSDIEKLRNERQNDLTLAQLQLKQHKSQVKERLSSDSRYQGSEDQRTDADFTQFLEQNIVTQRKAFNEVQTQAADAQKREISRMRLIQQKRIEALEASLRHLQNPQVDSLRAQRRFLEPWVSQGEKLFEMLRKQEIRKTPEAIALLKRAVAATKKSIALQAELAKISGSGQDQRMAERALTALNSKQRRHSVPEMSNEEWKVAVEQRADREKARRATAPVETLDGRSIADEADAARHAYESHRKIVDSTRAEFEAWKATLAQRPVTAEYEASEQAQKDSERMLDFYSRLGQQENFLEAAHLRNVSAQDELRRYERAHPMGSTSAASAGSPIARSARQTEALLELDASRSVYEKHLKEAESIRAEIKALEDSMAKEVLATDAYRLSPKAQTDQNKLRDLRKKLSEQERQLVKSDMEYRQAQGSFENAHRLGIGEQQDIAQRSGRQAVTPTQVSDRIRSSGYSPNEIQRMVEADENAKFNPPQPEAPTRVQAALQFVKDSCDAFYRRMRSARSE